MTRVKKIFTQKVVYCLFRGRLLSGCRVNVDSYVRDVLKNHSFEASLFLNIIWLKLVIVVLGLVSY